MNDATLVRWTTLLLMLAFTRVAVAQDVPNPLHAAWARTKLGATVVHTGNSKTMGLDTTIETTTKLQSRAADRVTLEVLRKVTTLGKTTDESKVTQDIRSTLPAAEKMTLIADANEVFLNGNTYRCKVYENLMQQGEIKLLTRTWLCDEVPGGVVKIEARTEGPIAMNTSIELKEIK